MVNLTLGIQTCTFFVLGALFVSQGDHRLGAAQLCLGVVGLLIYL